jgi:hypothetical protein
MARQKPLDPAIVEQWLAAWNDSEIFSDAAVRHLQSLITDPRCFVVITLSVGREPRSLVFRCMKRMIPVLIPPLPAFSKPTLYAVHGDNGRFQIRMSGGRPGIKQEAIPPFPEMIFSPVAPPAPSVGQLWYQTGVRSQKVPKLESVLRWDGAEWVIAGVVTEDGGATKQGMQVCGFQEALVDAHASTKWLDCEFIYTYDGSTWGNA